MVFHTATVRKLQRRGAPSQPSRKVLQDLALEKQFAALWLHREERFNLTCSCFFCALIGRGGTTSGFLRIISCRWFSPKQNRAATFCLGCLEGCWGLSWDVLGVCLEGMDKSQQSFSRE